MGQDDYGIFPNVNVLFGDRPTGVQSACVLQCLTEPRQVRKGLIADSRASRRRWVFHLDAAEIEVAQAMSMPGS